MGKVVCANKVLCVEEMRGMGWLGGGGERKYQLSRKQLDDSNLPTLIISQTLNVMQVVGRYMYVRVIERRYLHKCQLYYDQLPLRMIVNEYRLIARRCAIECFVNTCRFTCIRLLCVCVRVSFVRSAVIFRNSCQIRISVLSPHPPLQPVSSSSGEREGHRELLPRISILSRVPRKAGVSLKSLYVAGCLARQQQRVINVHVRGRKERLLLRLLFLLLLLLSCHESLSDSMFWCFFFSAGNESREPAYLHLETGYENARAF